MVIVTSIYGLDRSIHNNNSTTAAIARGEPMTCVPIFAVAPAFAAAVAVQIVVGEFAARIVGVDVVFAAAIVAPLVVGVQQLHRAGRLAVAGEAAPAALVLRAGLGAAMARPVPPVLAVRVMRATRSTGQFALVVGCAAISIALPARRQMINGQISGGARIGHDGP